MVLDFTMEKYWELCNAIVDNYIPLTVESYLKKKPKGNVVIMRHDVDRKPQKALKMAILESKLGINSTYYFRIKAEVFVPEIIKKIAEMGHEIGYHYEVLDKARGNVEKAILIFKEELEKFRKICEVKTICMHGNPLTPWDNKNIWEKYSFSDFGIVGEAYLSIDFGNVLYLSDTGRKWNSSIRAKDFVEGCMNTKGTLKSTDDIIRMLKNKEMQQICLLVHPNRWSENTIEWVKELLSQNIKNIGKFIIIQWRRFVCR